MRSRAWVLLVGVLMTATPGCGGNDLPPTCYPAPPIVTPGVARAGSVVTVTSTGFIGCRADRYRSYDLRLRDEAELGHSRLGAALGTVTVRRATGAFETQVWIPPRTEPGPHYLGYGRHPGDDYDYTCDDTNSCGGPAPNLTVIR